MKILILPRKTEAWDDLDPQKYYERHSKDGLDVHQQHGVLDWSEWALGDINFRFNMDLWNKKRKLPFVKYRAEIKRIARKTWKKANLEPADYVAGWPPNNFENRSDDLILIPMDDDDWVAPTIKEELLQVFSDPKISIVIWDIWILDTMNNKWEYHAANRGVMPCAYAVRSSMSNTEIEHSHYLVTGLLPTTPHVLLHKPLSVYQVYPGSTMVMRMYPFNAFRVKKIPHPPDLSWGHEEKEELYKLNLKIKPPKIF